MSSTPDDRLDEGLRLTFPASDPVAIAPDRPRLRIMLFGGAGALGKRIAREAITRRHELTMGGAVTDAASVASSARGFDVVIGAIDPAAEAAPSAALHGASALTEGLARAGIHRLVVVSETGALDKETLERYRNSKLEWTYVVPAALPGPGGEADERVAAAVLDELESPRHIGQQMTVAS